MGVIRVVLVDDHGVVRRGVAALLERQILELIGEGLTNRQIGERMFPATRLKAERGERGDLRPW
ncbi:hypothetical protein Pve01_54210 [Planomonospora venezuelensis]|uniref:DNA-binding NarL/FixJ family response regulator n=1 Tax=Planomonospora venezuelensis TaxID=1999 RepID=A0A841DHY7_PLAVE|nr:DNA-binding NarL/FixJ family response regulator [Planomonospora venezuelensis]GIN03763.1 hypothetical protein Pve01_54210 [Planomonospora venezuelensis]